MSEIWSRIAWELEPDTVLIRGSERYFKEKEKQRAKSALDEYEVSEVDGSELTESDVIDRIGSASLFSSKELVFVESVGSFCDPDVLIDLCQSPPEDRVVVFLTADSGREPSWLDDLTVEISRQSEDLSESETSTWMVERAEQAGFGLPERYARSLMMNVGENLFTLESELDKLFLYCRGKDRIGPEDIKDVIYPHSEMNPFDVIDHWTRRQQKAALKKMSIHFYQSGSDPSFKLVGMFQRRLERMIRARSSQKRGETVESAIDSYYVAQKLKGSLSSWDLRDLVECYGMMNRTEKAIKRGENGQVWMEYFIVNSI